MNLNGHDAAVYTDSNRTVRSAPPSKPPDLSCLFLREELAIEKRYNRVCLWVGSFFFLFSFILTFFTKSDYTNPNNISNIIGLSLFYGYSLLNRVILARGRYHWLQKYVTVFVSITCISIILTGYANAVDYVHATRSVTIAVYFIAIIISGLYQSPNLPLFAAGFAGIEYALIFFSAMSSGWPVYWQMETFQKNILTFDILIVKLVLFALAGFIVHLTARRHRILIRQRRDSVRQLIRATENQKKSEEKAVYFETYDELTGLPNQKYFRQLLNEHIIMSKARNRVFAVMCIGIDAFLNINQLYGMEVGNAVLKKVSDRLRRIYRHDDVCCRFLGDRFLVLFAEVGSGDGVSGLIEKTQTAFDIPVKIDVHQFRITASGGIVIFPNDGASPDELIKNAESAMYNAKFAGKNQFRLYDENRQQQVEKRLKIDKELRGALENNEFTLVFQPKVNREEKIVGAEALLRWSNPVLGPVPPSDFIPIAEKSGMIIPIGLYVFETCCRYVVKWASRGGTPIRITVNVSAVQFNRPDFTEIIKTVLDATGVDASWLGIEITETGIMVDEKECIQKLKAIKEMGLTISIDDFGIGYSSLKRLGDYPLDILKIDKSFVDGLPESTNSVTIVKSIVDLGHNLGYEIVAEGVETIEQRDFLRSAGCEQFQGYYYYKPMPAKAFEKQLALTSPALCQN